MHVPSERRHTKRERGSALVEFVVIFPMLFFCLLGAVDMGFYCYALIAVQNAARAVALFASSSTGSGDYANACGYVLANLKSMPNLQQIASCSSLPLKLTITSISGPDGNPATQVTISYQTVHLIPVYQLPGQITITRTVTARRRS